MYRPAIARSLYRTVGQFQKCSGFARTSSFCNFSIPSHISQCCYSAQATINNKEDAKNPKLQTVNDIFNAIPLKEEINYSIWVLEALSELPKAEQAVAVKDPKFLQIIQFLQANLQEFTPPDVTKCLKYLMILYPEEDPDVVKKMEDHIQQVDSRMSVNQLYEVVMSHKVTQTTNLRKEVFRQVKEKLFLRWTEVNEPNVLIGMLFMADDQALPNLETKALQLIEKMSQQQIFSVLFFLCQRKRRNKPLIRALVFHLNNKGKELTFGPNKLVHLARICDKLNIYDNVLLRRWSLAIYHHLMSETDFPEISISSLTWSISGLRWHDQTLIDALTKKVLLSDNKQSTDLLTSLFAMCATVNYMPTELRDSLPELCKAFDETFMKEKCRSFLEVVWSLAILQGLRESQLPLQYILGSEFQNKLKASLPDTVYPAACIKLMNINAEVKLNMPDYKGVLLPDDFLQTNSIQVPIKKHRPLVDKAAVALANMFPIEKFLKLDVQSHLGYLIDIEMLVNSVGKPQPVNSSNESLQKLAIKVLDFSDMTINTGEPTGRYRMMERHLSQSGYKFIMIPHHEIAEPQTTVKQVRYMQQKLELSRPTSSK